MPDYIDTDILIIGSGIGGGTAALRLAQAGLRVTVLTRAKDPHNTNTAWAQGGIIYKGHDDRPELLQTDIQNAGAHICNPEAVKILSEEGPIDVKRILIDELKVPFDVHDGEVSLALEGGHGMARIIHAADATGAAIETSLIEALRREPNVTLLPGYTAVDLITPGHHSTNWQSKYAPQTCLGAYALEIATGEVKRFFARRTILATGGLGQIFLYTTNPVGSRGDGLAMAYRAGARVMNCEYVQFHPTSFVKQGAPRFLITEAVRGDGGRLCHADGVPFMHKYDAHWKDLAPRDFVSRSIYSEMLDHSVPNVYLDFRSYISPQRIQEHFPNIFKACMQFGVDATKDLVPVAPAAHYFCGGVWVDDHGCTTIDRLYAVGEVSCTGLHGGNRLASTSLLEGLVWGVRAAKHVVMHLHADPPIAVDEYPAWQQTGDEQPDPALIAQDLSVIQNMMWNYVGLVRNRHRLSRALSELRHLESEIERFYRVARISDELIGLRNAVRSAVIVAQAAWENKQSIGCHYREN